MSFEDKTSLITGASGGIGSETARPLASEEASYITGETIQVDGGTRLLV